MVQLSPRVRGGPGKGFNALFNFGAGVLRYCPVDLTPGFSVGKLLDPIPESEQVTNVDSADSSFKSRHVEADPFTVEQDHSSVRTDCAGKALSLQEYLTLIRTDLGFSESDVQFSRTLHDVISSGGKFGATRESLRTHTSLCGLEHQLNVNEHIQTLLNFKMVRLCFHMIGLNCKALGVWQWAESTFDLVLCARVYSSGTPSGNQRRAPGVPFPF